MCQQVWNAVLQRDCKQNGKQNLNNLRELNFIDFVPQELLRNINDITGVRIIAKFGIGVVKYEICSNFKGKKHFNKISSISRNSSLKITYSIVENKYIRQDLDIDKIDNFYSQIEQIYEDSLFITGGRYFNQQKFTIHSQDKNERLRMQYQRFMHRTSFNKKNLIYIISGITNRNSISFDVSECQIFNMKTKSFSNILAIETRAHLFGCDQTCENVFVFGGFNYQSVSYKDEIQTYDSMINKWILCDQKLTLKAESSAIFVPRIQSFIIYANVSNLDTLIFDLKSITIHGEKYPSEIYDDYDFTKPVFS